MNFSGTNFNLKITYVLKSSRQFKMEHDMVHIERKRKRQDEIIGKAKEFGTITSKYSIELIINKKRKDYFHPTTSRRTKMNFVKILIETMLVPLSLFLHTIGLDFGHIELVEYLPTDSNLTHSEAALKIRRILKIHDNSTCKEDADYICLEAKDKAFMSERGYLNFRKTIMKIKGVAVTSLYGIRKLQKRINNFYKTNMNTMGCYVEPKEKLQFVLTKVYHKLNKNIVNDTFEIMLSGDGLQLTRTKTNTITFTFNVINAKDTSTSGLYTLGKHKNSIDHSISYYLIFSV